MTYTAEDLSTALGDVCAPWRALLPPSRQRVSESAQRHMIIKRPGGASGPWSAAETPYMVEPMDELASRRFGAVVFVGPAQTGKALDVDTPIATPAGWTTMGALTVGDTVFDEQGRPTRVVFATAFQHGRPCFEVSFSDGTSVVADAAHLWQVERFYWRAPTHRVEVLSTADMLGDYVLAERPGGRKRYRYRVRQQQPLQTPPANLEVDPYLLGVWLGDGSRNGAAVACHRDDAAHLVASFERAGHRVDVCPDRGNVVRLQIDRRGLLTTHCQRGHELAAEGRTSDGFCRRCSKDKYWRKRYGCGPNGEDLMSPPAMFSQTFASRLRRVGVFGDKHVPLAYLRAAPEQRWALFQGLMDTDGTVAKNAATAEFTSASQRLAETFTELARSLGLKATLRSKATTWVYLGVRKSGVAYRVTFPIPAGVELFRLPRKAQKQRTTERDDTEYRSIVSIRPVPTRPVKCIQVDSPSHLYLAGASMVPTHNTVALGEAWLTHAVVSDPGDMLIVQMTQDKAREYSKQRIDRLIRYSPDVQAMKSGASRDDNLHDKQFANGMWLRLAWPTATNLASTSYRYAFGTDYDRWPDDIDGEGDGFTMMRKRVTTFLSRGKVCVESSPGRPITDPSWRPATPHEAPPVGGILGIYNRSDRRRFYWPCLHCRSWFEAAPGLGLFRLPPEDELLESIRTLDIDAMSRQYARVACPQCGGVLYPADREAMNRAGRWLPEGVTLDDQGRLNGNPRVSDIAGFWLGGVAAAYVPWEALIRRQLQGLLEYELTNSELPLQTTANTDQGVPYLSRRLASAAEGRSGTRHQAGLERYVVPKWARFLAAAVDVQGGKNARFVVQVHAVGEHLQQSLVDRYALTWSARDGVDGGHAPLDPAAHAEDWDVLTEKVVKATYRVEGSDDLEMRVRVVFVDSGGEDGVTNNAYAWWRRLRAAGLHQRVRLTKGANTRVEWHIRETMVGGKQGSGDIPLQLLDPNKFKDIVSAGLARKAPGPGYYYWPEPVALGGWLPDAFFDELQAEVRNERGVWEQVKKRNEAFDLCYMIRAACMWLGCDRRGFWDAPPAWAAVEGNPDVVSAAVRRVEQAAPAPATAVAARRVARSSYLA